MLSTSVIANLLNFVTDAGPVICLGLNGAQYGPAEMATAKVCVRWLDVQDIGLDILMEGRQPIKLIVSAATEPALYEQLCGVVQSLAVFKQYVEDQVTRAAKTDPNVPEEFRDLVVAERSRQ